jgi:hypothetical protein
MNPLSSRLLPKNIKTETYKTILLYLTAVVRIENKLSVSEETILRIYLDLRRGSEKMLKKIARRGDS